MSGCPCYLQLLEITPRAGVSLLPLRSRLLSCFAAGATRNKKRPFGNSS